eukprot:945215-Heterocapsa_arctica.AAC.1
MDTGEFLDRGLHKRQDRVYGIFSGNPTKRETDSRKVRGNQNDKDRSAEHRQDEEDAFQFLCSLGGQPKNMFGRCGT